MKHFKIQTVLFVSLLVAVLSAVFLKVDISRGQSANNRQPTAGAGESRVKSTGMVSESRGATSATMPPSSVAAAAAASRNAASSTDLDWMFGKKPQRGWYLYVPLISRLIGTDLDAASPNFASAILRWQESSGLNRSGILDEQSLYAMIGHWQGARLKDRTAAQPDQLLQAPASDFFDPARPEELRQVERETYAAYKRMVAAAIADRSLGLASGPKGELASTEKFLKILSAFRTREYQDKLRRESPSAGSAGLAVNSPHFTGRALDLYVGGEPVETNDANRLIQVKTPVYKWLVRNAERFGFRPYFYEPWHWEYVGK